MQRSISFLIGRYFDQAPVRVAAINGSNRTKRTLLKDRSFFDCNIVLEEMLDDKLRRRVSQKAEVVATGSFVIRGKPFDLVRHNRAEIYLLLAELE